MRPAGKRVGRSVPDAVVGAEFGDGIIRGHLLGLGAEHCTRRQDGGQEEFHRRCAFIWIMIKEFDGFPDGHVIGWGLRRYGHRLCYGWRVKFIHGAGASTKAA